MENVGSYHYKWIVLLSSCFICSLTWGLAYTIGVFYISWVDQFDAGSAEVALIGGINTGIASLLGPVYDIIHDQIGYRRAGALGGVLISIGYIGSSTATNLAVLCIFYGVVLGFGFGLCYFGASLPVNRYFVHQRTLAEGVVTVGSGVGGFGFAILSQYLINNFGWRGALLIISGIASHIVVLFQLTFPPEHLKALRLDWRSDRATRSVKGKKENKDHDDDDSLCGTQPHLLTPSSEDIKEAQESGKRQTWVQRCLNMFKRPIFNLMLFAELLCWIGIYVPFVHLPERARLLGVDVTTVAWIASSISFSMSVGRLVVPGICDFLKVDPFYAYGVANGVAGLITILSSLLKTEFGLFSYAIIFGFSNCAVPLIRASTAALLGTEAFSMAYGWIIAVDGVGLFIGPALAGLLYDITSTYDLSFYVAGACLFTCGLLTILKNKAMDMQNNQFKKAEAIA